MLYYSHINEDNSVERELLRLSKSPTAVVVAGSGERVLALMDCVTCKRFAVVDINEEALFLLQLKLTVLENDSVETYLQFIGHESESAEFRLSHFDKVKPLLPPGCRLYWEQRKRSISKGILNAGHFEKFLNKVRPIIKVFLGPGFMKIFDRDFKSNEFPKWRWKVVMWLFSQGWMYKLFGNKDIAFIGKEVRTGHIPVAVDEMIITGKADSSFIAHLIFKGHLKEMTGEYLPPSFQPEVLSRIQKRLRTKDLAVDYYLNDLLAFTQLQLITAPAFYSVSDILSFEEPEYLSRLLQVIAVPGSIVVCRTFLRNRLTPFQLSELAARYGKVETHHQQDSTGMYQVFSVEGINQMK
jgi:S-adenosylmethionine:diacylglycerol 3-amino-3-carboxypropyl transferase